MSDAAPVVFVTDGAAEEAAEATGPTGPRKKRPSAVDTADDGRLNPRGVGFAANDQALSPSGRIYHAPAPYSAAKGPEAPAGHVAFAGAAATADDMKGTIVRQPTGFTTFRTQPDSDEEEGPHSAVCFPEEALVHPDMHGRIQRKQTGYTFSFPRAGAAGDGDGPMPGPGPGPVPAFWGTEPSSDPTSPLPLSTDGGGGSASTRGDAGLPWDPIAAAAAGRAVGFSSEVARQPDMHGRIKRRPTMYAPRNPSDLCSNGTGEADDASSSLVSPRSPPVTTAAATALGPGACWTVRGAILLQADAMTLRVLGDPTCGFPAAAAHSPLAGVQEAEAAGRRSAADEEAEQRVALLGRWVHAVARMVPPRKPSPAVSLYPPPSPSIASPRPTVPAPWPTQWPPTTTAASSRGAVPFPPFSAAPSLASVFASSPGPSMATPTLLPPYYAPAAGLIPRVYGQPVPAPAVAPVAPGPSSTLAAPFYPSYTPYFSGLSPRPPY